MGAGPATRRQAALRIAALAATIPASTDDPNDTMPTDGPDLFAPVTLGDLALSNRIVMAPLTRCRADEACGDVPGSDMNVTYYRQRSGAGLIISEGTQISPLGKGYRATPGIYSDAQVDGWRKITNAVHAAGSKIVAQIWHVGRISHPDLTGGRLPVAPSPVKPAVAANTASGKQDCPVPRALTLDEITTIVGEFRRAAANAIRAGFDGVEIHGANGYLVDQFLKDRTNLRTDRYGGSIENRCRFALEVVDACAAEIGAGRVGIRLSPVSPSNDIADSNPQAVFGPLVDALSQRKIAFIHCVEGATGGGRHLAGFDFAAARRHFRGGYIANNGYTLDMAREAVATGGADAIAFGRPFIANPDLVDRFRRAAVLATPDPSTFYAPGPEGYIDYPTL